VRTISPWSLVLALTLWVKSLFLALAFRFVSLLISLAFSHCYGSFTAHELSELTALAGPPSHWRPRQAAHLTVSYGLLTQQVANAILHFTSPPRDHSVVYARCPPASNTRFLGPTTVCFLKPHLHRFRRFAGQKRNPLTNSHRPMRRNETILSRRVGRAA